MQSNVGYQRIDICIKTMDTILDCSTQIKQEGASCTHKRKEKSDQGARDECGGIGSQLNNSGNRLNDNSEMRGQMQADI